MNPTIPARVQARNRADRRLQSMTLGAAVLGIGATGVFGYAAALSYTGQTTTANGSDQQGPADQPLVNSGSGSNGGSRSAGGTGTSGQTQPRPQTNVNPFFGQVAPPTTTKHRSHTSSGGS